MASLLVTRTGPGKNKRSKTSKEEGLGTSEWPITLKTIFALFLVKPREVSPILGVAVWVGYRPFHLHSVSFYRFGARVLMKCR